MIELRWYKPADDSGLVLQYRTSWTETWPNGVESEYWSDWRDVPVIYGDHSDDKQP